jgi:hypothetical protein
VDLFLTVPSKITAHIQEAHIFILHAICALIESAADAEPGGLALF